MSRKRLVVMLGALFLIALCWWNVVSARAGLVVRQLERQGVPLLYIVPVNATFGLQRPSNYVDRRMIWYGVHLLAWLALLAAIAPILAVKAIAHKTRLRSWLSLFLAPLLASGGLVLLNRFSDIDHLGGVLVGGAVSIWFGLAGLVWLIIMSQLPVLKLRSVGIGIVIFAVLWIGFGAMAQVVWLQWWLIPQRLSLFPLLALACFPWFLASGVAQQSLGLGKRILWWFGQSTVLVAGFILVLYLLPQLSFISLLLPLFPIMTAIFSFVASFLKEPCSYAIGSAMFFGWTLAAAFPLA